jgi:4-diphosphocytidyl-2-C-methyl-D-erythritol kinase
MRPIEEWKELLHNDFEDSVFALHPEIGRIKKSLYDAGAIYASMSGSGSSVFALFAKDKKPTLPKFSEDCFVFSTIMK